MTPQQEYAVGKVAEAFGWDRMTTADIGLLLWSVFRYYVERLRREQHG